MKNKEGLSAIIIVLNEEKMIEGCLKSLVNFADEIVVVDTGCTDNTIPICKKYGAVITKCLKGGYSDWRNHGLSKAQYRFVLYIDADERVEDALKAEFKSIVSSPNYSGYAIPRKNVVFGKILLHGGWYPDYVKRLFDTTKTKIKWVNKLHEEPVIDGDFRHMKSHLIHIKHETVYEMIEKTNKWSQIEAELMFNSNHPKMNEIRFCTAMLREFYYRMIKNRAFMDGKEGIIMAMYQVFSRLVSYSKLYEMQLKEKK